MRYKIKRNYWQQDIRRAEYICAILQGILLIGAISYLFYGTFWCTILLSPCLIRHMKSWKKQAIQKKKQAFQLQFKEAIHSLSAALNVGYSVENAIRETYKDLQQLYQKEEAILREFRYMVHQLDIHVAVETILSEFATRTGEEEVQTFVAVFSMAKRSGGDMIAIIRNAANQIREKLDVKREIETMMAAKKLEFRLMSAIPFAMICYLKLSFPDFMGVLYGKPVGIVIMTICLIVYGLAYEFGKRIVEVEV